MYIQSRDDHIDADNHEAHLQQAQRDVERHGRGRRRWREHKREQHCGWCQRWSPSSPSPSSSSLVRGPLGHTHQHQHLVHIAQRHRIAQAQATTLVQESHHTHLDRRRHCCHHCSHHVACFRALEIRQQLSFLFLLSLIKPNPFIPPFRSIMIFI